MGRCFVEQCRCDVSRILGAMVEKCAYDVHNTYVKCGSQAAFDVGVDDALCLGEKEKARRLGRASGEERRKKEEGCSVIGLFSR